MRAPSLKPATLNWQTWTLVVVTLALVLALAALAF